MPEHNPLISSYVHLGKERRADEALHTLKKVDSLVKPIMRDRGWKVGQLAEFYPQEPSLLGMSHVRSLQARRWLISLPDRPQRGQREQNLSAAAAPR